MLHDAEEITKQLQTITDAAEKSMLLDTLAQRLIIPYLMMAGILLVLALMVRLAKLPEINPEEETSTQKFENSHKTIWSYPQLWLGVIALFLYVGVEVIAGDTIIRYGQSLDVAMESAKYFTSLTLIAMVIGYFVGIALIPKVISQKTALMICAILGLTFTSLAVYTPNDVLLHFPMLDFMTLKTVQLTIPLTVLFIALLGVANSLMWPAIWPLALDGVGKYLKLGSALLIMAIAGGAVLPLVYGFLASFIGTQTAYFN